MADSTIWWVVTGLLVAIELMTGTFYLLMLSIGAVASALAAHVGFEQSAQIIIGAFVGGMAVLAAYLVKRRRPGDPSARAERSVNLDVGETVHIDGWNLDGTAQIRYRGAQWTAQLRPGMLPHPGPHRVIELIGSRLLVEPI